MEKLGPVTYNVETTEGHRWKRHTDQLKSFSHELVPPLRVEPELDSGPEPDVSEDSTPDMPPDPGVVEPESPEQAGEAESPEELPVETDTASTVPIHSPPEAASTSEANSSSKRYPSRVRQTPDWFHAVTDWNNGRT